ncbi:MAG: phosphatase PAP2 family protein [Flavobacteriales bacterium]|nr:phosphatase PAP2 family protein [Flavobacteriales bacterium]
MELISDLDRELFLFLNGIHNDFFDWLMYWVSYKWTWIPFYAYLIYYVVTNNKKTGWLVFGSIVVLIAASDLISVHLFKNVFQRYRPCHNLLIQDVVHMVKGHCGGQYGFVSSHSSTSFAIAFFVSHFLKSKAVVIGIILWAAVVAYSRIYLGVHYPLDIFCGMLLGLGVSNLTIGLYSYFSGKILKVEV